MVSRFGRNPTELCFIFNTVLEFVYNSHHHRLESWNQPFLLPQVLERYAQIIHNRSAPLQNCFGFVDGTLCRIAKKSNDSTTTDGSDATAATADAADVVRVQNAVPEAFKT